MTSKTEFWDFVTEREMIRTKKEQGCTHPLTQDPRLKDYWFPNIRREDDPTTVWFRATIRDHIVDPHQLLMAVVAFRMFNSVATGERIQKMMLRHGYDRDQLLRALGGRVGNHNAHLPWGVQPYTLAKAVTILEQFQQMGQVHCRMEGGNLERAHEALCETRGIGTALGYEIICDLRRTQWLLLATDVNTWAAPTPMVCHGAGLILGREMRSTRTADRAAVVALMQELRAAGSGWEMAEAHRALCLYYIWKRPEQPKRRYTWK